VVIVEESTAYPYFELDIVVRTNPFMKPQVGIQNGMRKSDRSCLHHYHHNPVLSLVRSAT
jgi:hypothetical protein